MRTKGKPMPNRITPTTNTPQFKKRFPNYDFSIGGLVLPQRISAQPPAINMIVTGRLHNSCIGPRNSSYNPPNTPYRSSTQPAILLNLHTDCFLMSRIPYLSYLRLVLNTNSNILQLYHNSKIYQKVTGCSEK